MAHATYELTTLVLVATTSSSLGRVAGTAQVVPRRVLAWRISTVVAQYPRWSIYCD